MRKEQICSLSDWCCSGNLNAADLATTELFYKSHVAFETHFFKPCDCKSSFSRQKDPANWHSAVLSLPQC